MAHLQHNALGFYNFEDAEALGADISAADNTATLSGGAAVASSNGRTNVLSLAEADHLNLDAHLAQYQSLTKFGVSFWFRTTTTGAIQGLFSTSVSTSTATDVVLFINVDNTLRFQYRQATAVSFHLGTLGAVTDGAWHHVMASCGPSGPKLYVDGMDNAQAGNLVGGSLANTESLDVVPWEFIRVGHQYVGTPRYGFTGEIDDFVLGEFEATQSAASDIYDNDRYGYEVVPLFGQSNMVGSAAIRAGIDDDYTLVAGKVFQYGYDAQAILDATNPLDHVSSGGSGLWRTFAESYIDHLPYKKALLLVPAAEGGTAFNYGDWNPGDPRYTNSVSRVNEALALNGLNTLPCFLWHQGGSDANSGSTTYQQDIQAMYDQLLSDIEPMTANTPFILGSILGAELRPGVPAVNAAMVSFAKANSAVAYVGLADLAYFDGAHFDSESIAIVGTRYAQAALADPAQGGIPLPITLRSLYPATKLGNESPIVATSEALRGGGPREVVNPSNAQTITIIGSGFGAIANPLPSAYDDLTDYPSLVAGDPVPIGTEEAKYTHQPSSHSIPVLDDSIKLPGRPFSFNPQDVKGAMHGLKPLEGGQSRSPTSVYCSGWMYLTVSPFAQSHPDDYVSFKYCRIWGGTTGENHLRTSTLFRNGRPVDSPSVGATSLPYPGYFTETFPANEFVRAEFEVDSAVFDAGTNRYTGVMRIWVDGQLKTLTNNSNSFEGTEISVNWGTEHTWQGEDTGVFTDLRFSMFGSDPSQPDRLDQSFRCHMMEIHEQATRARVEVSSSATWTDTEKMLRFYQKTTLRTDTQIEFELFSGTLDISAPLYAYVVQEDGSVNQNGILINSDTVTGVDWGAL